MRLNLIDDLVCPYTGGPMWPTSVVQGDVDRIDFGIVSSECFDFPVVGGVLLLGLTKGYGGPEEKLAPYVALQAASLTFLGRNDVVGLLGWMRQHSPLAHRLLTGEISTYTDFALELAQTTAALDATAMTRDADLEVLGDVGARGRLHDIAARTRLHRVIGRRSIGLAHRAVTGARKLRTRLQNTKAQRDSAIAENFYAQRFFSPRAAGTAFTISTLDTTGPILSVCCGHGMFENLLNQSGRRPRELVCVDGQLINLLALRAFVDPHVDAICHDVQLDWPFPDKYFQGVFSSSCLPEVPAQAHVIREAVRLTRDSGWTLFDSIWALDSGVQRCDPYRPYRYLQNFLPTLASYRDVFSRQAGGKKVHYALCRPAAEIVDGPAWASSPADIDAEFATARDTELNVLIVDPEKFGGFVPADHGWMAHCRLSPAYRTVDSAAQIRSGFDVTSSVFAPVGFRGMPTRLPSARLTEDPVGAFADSVTAPLPDRFDGSVRLGQPG